MGQNFKEYQVNLIQKNKSLFSKNEDSIFSEKANCLTDFCSPWDKNIFSKIEFRALWDLEHFFFEFIVFDTDVYIDKKNDRFENIGNSDRVELFFRTNANLDPYYCLEMDTAARIMDFKAHPNKNFDFDWKWPQKDLEVKAARDKNFFTVRGQITIQSLQELNLIQNNTLEIGVFRAKYNKIKDSLYQPTWISWVNPNTETPNFHIASSFGRFILVK